MTDREVRRPPWSEVQARLAALDFHPSRRLGQNFLRDENTVRTIVRTAEIAAGEVVIEIGTGCGFLTLHLTAAGADVRAIEIDARLLDLTRGLLGRGASWRATCADVLDGKNALSSEFLSLIPEQGEWKLVSNLPYSVAAPVVALVAGLERAPELLLVLVQREMAERLTARVGSKDYGWLSLEVQSNYALEKLRRVGPESFWPRPEVDSNLVLGRRRADRPVESDRRRLRAWARPLFQRRRQTLLRLLSELIGSRVVATELLERHGLPAASRPEQLDPPRWLALVRDLPEAPARESD